MEFWGVEIKPGETLKIDPTENKNLHLTQASLGKTKDKGSENVSLFVNFDNQELVLGHLCAEKYPQVQFDLFLEKEFELYHTSKKTSVYFCGYKTSAAEEDDSEFDDYGDFELEEADLKELLANGIDLRHVKATLGKPNTLKSDALAAKAKVKPENLEDGDTENIEDDDGTDEDDEDEDDTDSEEPSSSEDLLGSSDEDNEEDDSSDADDDDEEEDNNEVTPGKKAVPGDKRPAPSASKNPASEKKAKLTPVGIQRTGATTTPHPAKSGLKALDKINGSSNRKSFNSKKPLQGNKSRARHGNK